MSTPALIGQKDQGCKRAMSNSKQSVPAQTKSRHDAVTSSPRTQITAEERHRQIPKRPITVLCAEFPCGADLEDWLESEAEIDKLIWHG